MRKSAGNSVSKSAPLQMITRSNDHPRPSELSIQSGSTLVIVVPNSSCTPTLLASQPGSERTAAQRVDGKLARAEQSAQKSVRIGGRRSPNDFVSRQEGTLVTEAPCLVRNFFEHSPLVLAMSQMDRSARVHPQPGVVRQFQPRLPAAQGQSVRGSGRLPDWPDHPEIANRRPDRRRPAFE